MTGKLKVTTPSDREVMVTRVFDASPKLVFDAHTKPELVKRWLLGPPGWAMPICEIDLRVGGGYRYGWSHPTEGSFEMTGVYREIIPARRIVHTERFNDAESLSTLMLTETDGKTTMTYTMDFGSKELRDAAVATGMTDGMESSYARLDEIFAKQT